jgi:hypothetical protein
MGSEAHNIEPVRILGIDIQLADDSTSMNRSIYRDFSEGEYTIVATGQQHRVDAAVAIYGFALSALFDRDEMKAKYDQFRDRRQEVLHIHRDWEHLAGDW